MLNVFYKSDLIFFSWMESNDIYSFERAPVNSLLPYICAYIVFLGGAQVSYPVQSATGT